MGHENEFEEKGHCSYFNVVFGCISLYLYSVVFTVQCTVSKTNANVRCQMQGSFVLFAEASLLNPLQEIHASKGQ